jgi:hypothetical protein
MRFKLTILLVFLNVALFLTLFYMDKHADSARAFEDQNSLVLKPGSLEQADALELDGAGAPAHWLIQKQGTDWSMVRPQAWPVNQYAVQNILDKLRFLRMEARFPLSDIEKSGMTLADYGLDNPSVTLRISGAGKTTTLLRIGAPTKIGARLYVLSADGKNVYVTSRDLLRALLVSLEDLRDQRIFNIPSYMVTSISMQRADGARVRLDKLGIGWEFESPIRADADDDAVESLLADMGALKVHAFAAQDPAAQGLLSPRLRIGIETSENRLSLLLGNAAEDGLIYAKLENSPEVFTLDASIVDRFQQSQEALRQRHFSRINKAALCGIHIGMGAQTATLQKLETGEWQVLRQNQADGVQTWKADPQIVQDLIETLDTLYALRFVSDAPSESDLDGYGFKDPQREVALQFPKSDSALFLGNLEAKLHGVYVKTAAEPFVYEVADSAIDKLDPTPLHYRTRELETLPPAAKVLRLRIGRIGEPTPVIDIAPQAGQTWMQAIAAGRTPAQASALTTVLAYAGAGRAESFIASTYEDALPLGDGKTQPWLWRLDADIDLPSGTAQSATRTISYVFTDRVGGTSQFGGSRELGLMFSIPQSMIDALHALLFDHPKPAAQELPPAPQPATNSPAPTDVQNQQDKLAPAAPAAAPAAAAR